MSEASTIAAIKTIVENTELTPEGQIIYAGKVQATLTVTQPKPADWQNLLLNVLYTQCYCTGLEPAETPVSQPTDEVTLNTFLADLRGANQTQAGWEPGWQVEAVDAYGLVWASKGGESRSLYPGEFTVESAWQVPVKPGTWVQGKTFKETLPDDNAFYYVYSQTLPDKTETNLVRFYWNLEPAGAPVLIEEITNRFNRFGLPFQFKCLRELAMYQRADAAVLYLAKKDVAVAGHLINQIYPRLKPFLKTAVPLFCKKLGPGLGFAENPGNGESFGMHRCRLLAQGMVQAQVNQQNKSETVAEVVSVFKNNGFALDALYLNPNAHYPYQLPTLN